MKRKAPDEETESVQSLVNHLSHHAKSAYLSHSILSIELYAVRPVPGDRDNGLVAEFCDIDDIDCAKRQVCAFLDTHTYVACIAIEYSSGGSPLSLASPEHKEALTMEDGYRLPVDIHMRHIASVAASTTFGSTANIRDLHNLARRDQLAELQELVPYFHVNRISRGKTLLHIAVIHGHTRIIGWLLQQPGIEIDATDDTGATAFLWAAYELSVSSMILLHRYGASLLAADRNGRYALFEVVCMATKDNMDEVRACLAFLGEHMPLVPQGRRLSQAYETKESVQQELRFMGRRIRDKVFEYVYARCTVRVLADLVVQYWEGDLSLLEIP
jgi:ankyrin repeat protein